MTRNLDGEIEAYVHQLRTHSMYGAIRCETDVRTFMENHVFAVWDFMCILKSLQRQLTCVETVWSPSHDRSACRMINEIVLCEESDVGPDGASTSHFELYVSAMRQIGADTGPILNLVNEVGATHRWPRDLTKLGVPAPARTFLNHTRLLLRQAKLHELAAVFTYGRETVIPQMFRTLLLELNADQNNFSTLIYYLNRHVEVDDEEHGPLARRMVEQLCGDDTQLWNQAHQSAEQALMARCNFWEDIQSFLAPEPSQLVKQQAAVQVDGALA